MRRCWVTTPLLLLLVSTRSWAQTDADVGSAYADAALGIAAFDNGRNEEALDKFLSAHARLQLPSLAVLAARAHAKLGHLLAATALYAEAAQLPDGLGDHDAQQQARESAVIEREALTHRIPKLVVSSQGPPVAAVEYRVDATVVPALELAGGWQLDPGPHQITAQLGERQQQRAISLAEGETQSITFDFGVKMPNPPPAPPPDTTAVSRTGDAMRTAGWVSLGLGGVSLAVAGTTGIWAVSQKRDLNSAGPWSVTDCGNAPSPDECNSYRRLRTISTVGFYTGLVGATTGAILLLTAPKSNRTGSVTALKPWIAVGAAGLTGQFR